jgi:hypothetical protein
MTKNVSKSAAPNSAQPHGDVTKSANRPGAWTPMSAVSIIPVMVSPPGAVFAPMLPCNTCCRHTTDW